MLTTANVFLPHMKVEMGFNDVEERCRTLEMYGISGSGDIMANAAGLPKKWATLYNRSKETEASLQSVRRRLVAALEQRLQCAVARSQRVLRLFRHGGYYGRDDLKLEEAADLLRVFGRRAARAAEEGEEIRRRQRVFKLPLTQFNTLAALQRDIDANERVLAIFDDYRRTTKALEKQPLAGFSLKGRWQGELSAQQERANGVGVDGPGKPIADKLRARITGTLACLGYLDRLMKGGLSQRHWRRLTTDYTNLAEGLSLPDNADDDKNDTSSILSVLHAGLFVEVDVGLMADATHKTLGDVGAEQNVVKALAKVTRRWEEAKLSFERWSGQRGDQKLVVPFVADVDQLLDGLDADSRELASTLEAAGAAGAAFAERIAKQRSLLTSMAACLRKWAAVQSDCLALARVFVRYCSVTTGGRVPSSAAAPMGEFATAAQQLAPFEAEIKRYARMMNECVKRPAVTTTLSSHTSGELIRFSSSFGAYLKASTQLVEAVRQRSPRLKLMHFREVLTLLGGREVGCEDDFEAALVKVFGSGITGVAFDDGRRVKAVANVRGETLPLAQPVSYDPATSSLDVFLDELTNEVRSNYNY
jgi:hypothetical protein